ncbi:MAG: hypothetical protein QNL98_08365 [Mycobacterium sp.]
MTIWDRFLGRSDTPAARDRHDYRTVSVSGTWTRTVVGSSAYANTLNALPLGPVQVTLRLQQRGADTHAVAAYVAEQQVGWLATQRSLIESRLASGFLWRDSSVTWMTKLDAAGIRPTLQGLIRVTRDDPVSRLINIDFPGRGDPNLSVIAKQLIAANPNRR